MKRIIAIPLAIATALSLSTGTASGQIVGPNPLQSSKDVPEVKGEVRDWQLEHRKMGTQYEDPTSSVTLVENSSETVKKNSSQETYDSLATSSWNTAKSSFEDDFANEDPFGTRIDQAVGIISIISIGAVLYGIALQAGVPLPHIAPE